MLSIHKNLENRNLQGKYVLYANPVGYCIAKIEKLSIAEQHTLDECRQTIGTALWQQTKDSRWREVEEVDLRTIIFNKIQKVLTVEELASNYFDLLL